MNSGDSSRDANTTGLLEKLPILKRIKRPIVELIVFTGLVNLLTLTIPFIVTVIIDKVIVYKDIDTLLVMGAILSGFVFIEVIFRGLKNYLYNHFSTQVISSLGGTLFNKLLGLNFDYFKNNTIGSITTRMQELSKIQRFLTDVVIMCKRE
ncbi:MAG: hypothetical protein GY820_22700 [Gammaproteobacteria bacterium]|nr:hypothetical protein [Gammaproteobacteria bacterium]